MINTAHRMTIPIVASGKSLVLSPKSEELFCFNFPYSGYMVIFSLTFEHE